MGSIVIIQWIHCCTGGIVAYFQTGAIDRRTNLSYVRWQKSCPTDDADGKDPAVSNVLSVWALLYHNQTSYRLELIRPDRGFLKPLLVQQDCKC
jgi:hypothetical protein